MHRDRGLASAHEWYQFSDTNLFDSPAHGTVYAFACRERDTLARRGFVTNLDHWSSNEDRLIVIGTRVHRVALYLQS